MTRTDARRVVDVSVVIATFNRSVLVRESLASVMSQTVRPKEIVVVDDGSSDDTVDVLTPLAEAGEITLVALPENRGQAAAFNAGIAASTGRYVAIQSSDDLWLPNKLEIQVGLLDRTPEAGFAYSNLLNWDPDSGRMWQRVRKRLPSGDLYEGLAFRRVFMSWITVLVRRECLEEVGTFDERLRRHEDRDLSVRLAARYRVEAAQEPLAIVRLHGASSPKDPADTFDFDQWVAYERILVDKIVATSPSPLFARRLRARYDYVWGRGYMQRGIRGAALRHLGRSIGTWPFAPHAWAFLPLAVVRGSRREMHGG